MQITNSGKGVHAREVPGIDKLRNLPTAWYAFTNLDLALQGGKSREIDVIIVADDRIFVVDLKDWNGDIESADGRWYQNGQDRGRSPVSKIHENAKQILYLLAADLKRHAKGVKIATPRIEGVIVVSGSASLDKIAPTEVGSVYRIEDFTKIVSAPASRSKAFEPASPIFATQPLTSGEWKHRLGRFFNVTTGVFRPGQRSYGGYKSASDDATFRHASDVYREYDATEDNPSQSTGLLRVWNFSKCADTRFQSEEGRKEIAGREREVISYLNDRNPDCEATILQPKAEDTERGVSHWEIFERRRRLRRLTDFIGAETERLSNESRLELARQILARAKTLHDIDAAHLDIGPHSVWLEAPSLVRFSHLMAARYPDVRSLGDTRYQFLSSAKVPEDILGGSADAKRKDVFLLGVTVHYLLFDAPPASNTPGDPPEWAASIDATDAFHDLHVWFEKTLSWDASTRYADAGLALDAFNETLATKPSQKTVIEGLERFSATIKSQLQLFASFPPHEMLRDEKHLAMWRTNRDGQDLLVKMWKRASWDDQVREGPRILAFLERAKGLIQSPPPGTARIREVHWLGDAIVLIQDWIVAKDLAGSLSSSPLDWQPPKHALSFIQRLTQCVVGLHSVGLAHGDLKPQNILVLDDDGPSPLLIDLLDFSPASDGEIMSTAYAPPTGGRIERDRYAVTKIAEECFACSTIATGAAADISRAIATCRTSPPENGTLLPLLEALERTLAPRDTPTPRLLAIGIRQAETGPVLSDEGAFYLRRAPDRPSLFIRGACEELEIRLDLDGNAFSGRRIPIDQKRIALVSRFEFMSVVADIEVRRSDLNDFSALSDLLSDPEFRENWNKSTTPPQSVTEDDVTNSIEGAGDDAEDALIEAVTIERPSDGQLDLPLLWRRLIDAEEDLTIEGVAAGESSFRRDIKRHIVPFELESGVLDFNRDDRVLVERYDRRGRWQKIGDLDIARSRPNVIVIDAQRRSTNSTDKLVDAEQRLRFHSHFQLTSRVRREQATSRILSRESRITNLIDIFDPRINEPPSRLHTSINRDAVRERYGLNESQIDAFAALVALRPVGLLQGPPGTGKTRFIASIVHYALTEGLASNVLLASQSHEAVNNAAEAVLRLFKPSDKQLSILRVGHEGSVSDPLVPFHTARVEGLYKDRFRASLKERLRSAGRPLGIKKDVLNDIAFVETAMRPVLEKLHELAGEGPPEAKLHLFRELKTTAERQLQKLGVSIDLSGEISGRDLLSEIINSVVGKQPDLSPDRIARFRSIVRLARDFIGSVSTAERSFEAFLAGTRQIVAGTCVGLGRSSLGLMTTPFDLVVVDEAARCTASELSVPVQAGRWVLLVGDQKQLEPFHNGEIVEQVAHDTKVPRREILRSDFERVFETSYGKAAGCRLTTQYRMWPPIGRIVSSSFYDGTLEHGRKRLEIDPVILPEDLEKPLLWLATDGLGELAFQKRGPDGASSFNQTEADLVVALLRRWDTHEPFRGWLLNQSTHVHPVGVICTYAAQRDLLRRKLQAANLSDILRSAVKIDTVDSYQGKENLIVILSLVRNNADGVIQSGSATIRQGYMARSNRINVAMSRAMDRLVVVGAKHRWPANSPMARVSKAFDLEVLNGMAEVIDASAVQMETDSGRTRKRRREREPAKSAETSK